MSAFTAEEKRMIVTSLNAYPETPELSPIIKSALEKLSTTTTSIPDAYSYFEGKIHTMKNSIDGSPVGIAMLGPNSFPVLKFTECPRMLPLKDVFNLVEAYQWSPTYRFTYDPELSEVHITNIKEPTNPLVLPLNIFEMELLFAFYIYHVLAEKGVEQSGLIPAEAQETTDTRNSETPQA